MTIFTTAFGFNDNGSMVVPPSIMSSAITHLYLRRGA